MAHHQQPVLVYPYYPESPNPIEIESALYNQQRLIVAETFANHTSLRRVQKNHVKPVIDEIKAVNSDVMLVGHLPFMAKLASMMLMSNENKCNITFSTGALGCFNYDKDSFSLDWFIYPGLITQGDIGSFQSYH